MAIHTPIVRSVAVAEHRAIPLLAAVVGLVVVIAALNLAALAPATSLQRAAASLLLGLCALPSLMWLSNRHWPHSAMPHAGALYAAYFALPVFLLPRLEPYWSRALPLGEDAIEAALLLALAGWVAMLVGHFAPRAGWLPRVEVCAADPRIAKMLAAAAAIVGVPCFYLDNMAVLAQYQGRALSSSAAFPISFLGQLVVFAVLVLFHLHLRGQLGLIGRVCLVVLTAYYTVFGFSTGMVNSGLKAMFGLFVAYAAVVSRPTWRSVAWGAFAAAALLLLVLPSRGYYRQLVWTHGAEPVTMALLRGHELDAQEQTEQVVETPAYNIALHDRVLKLAHHDHNVCHLAVPRSFDVFVNVHPVDADVLDYPERLYGFERLDFSFTRGRVEGGDCVHDIRLPDYATRFVRVGLERLAKPVARTDYMPGRLELKSVVADRAADVEASGEWRLDTRDAITWEIVPSSHGHSRLLVAAPEEQLRQMAMTNANNRIRLEVDERNWAEYVVSEVHFSGQLATYRLSELRAWRGDRSMLTEDASATLRYEQAGPIFAAFSWPGERPREGTNPNAPYASRSLVRSVTLFLHNLALASVDDPLMQFHRLTRRFDFLLPVAWVMASTPVPVPYLNGETLRPLLYKLLPRFAFENKPADVRHIGQRYGFLLPEHHVRGFKVHQLGEFYANFGPVGAIAGMLVLGLLLRAVHDMLHHATASAVTMAAGTHILTVLVLEMESILSVSWGFVIWYALALAVLGIATRAARRLLDSRPGGEAPREINA